MAIRLMTLTLAALFSMSWLPAWADTLEQVKKDGLRVCTEPAYMPFEMINKGGEMIGFDIDLAGVIAKELGTKAIFVKTAWNDLIPSLIGNKCDIIMSGMTITDERRQKIEFTESYISIGQTVLLRKDLADKVKSYEDLNDPKYKVATKSGTTSEVTVKEKLAKAQYLPFKDQQEAILEVVNGKADAFIYDSPYNTIAIERLGSGKLIHLDAPLTLEHLGFGVRKEDNAFRNWLNTFLGTIKNTAKNDLYRKWFKRTDWLKEVD